MRYEPLSRYPALRTRHVEELRKQLEGLFSVWSMDFGGGEEKTFEGRLNHRQMQDVGVTYARYGAAMAVSLSQADFYLQGFPLKGGGSFVLDGAEGLVSRNFGIVGGPGADMRIKYSSDFQHLIVRIKPERLTRTLSDLLGQPVIQPLKMESSVGPIAEVAGAQRRLLEFVVRELDRDDDPLPALVLAELEQALVVSYLTCNRHNYSHLLERPQQAVGSSQVHRAEEYIEQNWDQPVSVEALAVVANASVRSLFYSFKKSRGVSPMAFVRQVRLRHANELLQRPGPETNVTSVAFTCGFSNLGHFARYYHSAFGEHPSATLRKALGRATS